MGGGYVQLYAIGPESLILTSGPRKKSLFRSSFVRHYHFSCKNVSFPIEARFGSKVSMQIQPNSDLVNKMVLRLRLPDITGEHVDKGSFVGWVRRLGHAMIKEMSVTLDGCTYGRYTGVLLDIMYELCHQSGHSTGYSDLIGDCPSLTVLKQRTSDIASDIVLEGRDIYVPLQFWFNRSTEFSLPVFMLSKQDIRLNIEFEDVSKLLVWRGRTVPRFSNIHPRNAEIISEYIALSDRERARFVERPPKYIVEQWQLNGEEGLTGTGGEVNDQKFTLNFNHPTKEVIFATRLGAFNGESNNNAFSGARSRFITYSPTGDWNAALQYAACNLVRGMVWFREPENKHGKIPQLDWIRLDGANSLSGISLNDCEAESFRICIDNCRFFTLSFVNRTGSDNPCNMANGASAWSDSEAGALYVTIDGSNIPPIWILKRNVAVVSNKYDLTSFIHEARIEIGLRRNASGNIYGSVDNVSINQPNPDGRCEHTLSLCDVSIPVNDWIVDNRSTTYEFDASGHRNSFDYVITQFNNYGSRLDGAGNIVSDATILLNNKSHNCMLPGDFYNKVQTLRVHNNIPANGIYVYPFAFHPSKSQLSGNINFTEIANKQLHAKFCDPFRHGKNIPALDLVKGTKVYIFASSINHFKINGDGTGKMIFSE